MRHIPHPPRRMEHIAVILAVLSFALSAPGVSAAAAVNDCHYGIGGAYHNLTTRVTPCREAKGFHGLAFRILNALTARRHYTNFYWHGWHVRAHCYHDPRYPHIEGGDSQLDVRSTASGGRVVRFQTSWD